MYFPEKLITLKDGRTAIFRGPRPEDAEDALEYMKLTASETPFLLRGPEEVLMSVEDEAQYLARSAESRTEMMILCFVDGRLAGNCQINRKKKQKNTHRGSIGIAIIREFWNLGIGTAMFTELISAAKQWGLLQLELEVIEGNQRAMALYRKMGFETVSYVPNAIRMPDGTFAKEYLMIKQL